MISPTIQIGGKPSPPPPSLMEAAVANKLTHTPGPWLLNGHNLSSIIRCTVPKGHPDAKHICGDYEQIASAHGDNWQANARLIAAAPDLLEALKLAREEMISSGNWAASDFGWPKARLSVDAAIAKATGRAALNQDGGA